MPEFSPSESRTAIAPITVKPAGLNCLAELYLVSDSAKVVTSGLISFTSTGAKQNISLPITMPSVGGTYPVWIDVFADGILIGAYISTEDVVIVTLIPGTETLRPIGPGSKTEIELETPRGAAHYSLVNEVSPDDAATTVYEAEGRSESPHCIDLYDLPPGSGLGTITSVKLYFRSYWYLTDYVGGWERYFKGEVKGVIKTHNREYKTSIKSNLEAWKTDSETWEVNPFTGKPWTWLEINESEAGVEIYARAKYSVGNVYVYCTQVYVEVNYVEKVVEPVPGADIRLENLVISPIVNIGEPVSISITATNYGTASGSKLVTCRVT